MTEAPNQIAEVVSLPIKNLNDEQRELAKNIAKSLHELDFFLKVLQGEPVKRIDENVLIFDAKVIAQDKPKWFKYIHTLSRKLRICYKNVHKDDAKKVFTDLLNDVGDVREVVFANFSVTKTDVDLYVQSRGAQIVNLLQDEPA